MPNQKNREAVIATEGLRVVFPEDILKAKQDLSFSDKVPIKWVYLGDNPLGRRKILHFLGENFELIDIARCQRRIAGQNKSAYVAWHDDLNRSYADGSSWWFGAVSSRNVRQSNVFQYYCFLEVLKQLWSDGAQRPQLVVVESEGLAESIRIWALGQKIPVKISGAVPLVFSRPLKRGVYTSLRWGKFWAVRILRASAVFFLRWKGLGPLSGQKDDCLIVTTVHDYSISSEGVFLDRYFPLLHSLLEQQGDHIVVCPFFYGFSYNYFSIYQRLRKSKTRFILPEDLLKFSDYWDVLLYPLMVLQRSKKVKTFRGFDLSSIIREEFCEQDTVLGLEPLLIYKAYLRMAKRFASLKKAIVWYENRVIDRAVVMGLRKSFPEMEVKGVQMYLHPQYFLSMAPSSSEVESGVVPHLVLTTSAHECGMAQVFSSDIACRPAAALRYRHLYEETAEQVARRSEDVSKNILILLPYNIGEAVEILEIVAESLAALKKSIRFLIKAHPDYTIGQVKAAFGEAWPACFDAFDGHLAQGVALSGMVISGMSSAMVEAAIKGTPVIFVGGQTSLEENFMAGLGLEMTVDCFSAPELVKAIEHYSSLSQEQREAFHEEGQRLRNIFFLPVNETTLKPYLS